MESIRESTNGVEFNTGITDRLRVAPSNDHFIIPVGKRPLLGKRHSWPTDIHG